MEQNTQVEYDVKGDELTLKLSGYINHFFEIDLNKTENFKLVNVDFENVTLINSLGIKKWFQVIAAIGPETQIKYHNIPPSIVTQMSLVVGFLPKNVEVMTFYAPYFDRATKKSTKVLLTPDKVTDGKAPVMKNDLGEDLIIDAIEEIYFSFLEKKSEK